jgi:hypothetical protein
MFAMSGFSLENFPLPFSGGDDDFDFNPLGLFKEASQFRLPGLPSMEPSSLDFGNPFEKITSFDVPNPSEILGLNFGDGGLGGRFGDSFGNFSNLLSSPGRLFEMGLFGGPEDIGGIIGNFTNPVKNMFSGLGDFGGLGGKLGGILGGAMDFLGPASGIIGGLFGRGQEGVKGLISSVMSGFSFGGPIGAGIMGLAHITGLDKLAGKALGGIGKAIGGVGKAIGGGIKKIFGGLF